MGKQLMFVKGGIKANGTVSVNKDDAKYIGTGHAPAMMSNTIIVVPKQKVHKEINSFSTECRCIFAHVITLGGKYMYTESMYISAFQRATYGTETVTVPAIDAQTKAGKHYVKGEFEPSFSNINVPLRVGKIAVEGSNDTFELAITEPVAYSVSKGSLHYMPEYEFTNGMVSAVTTEIDGERVLKLNRKYLNELSLTEYPDNEDYKMLPAGLDAYKL